ncbi:GNAT family N-acetyltransferase [Nibribacter koreensis]|uniref:N-acetyltransferase domain-containing protein n=1 Tax=Nibribacter koreensis TaxID=1084519 RepID=A0ABP8FSD7_9BACT
MISSFTIRPITSHQEMLDQYRLIQLLNPHMTQERYTQLIDQMHPSAYRMVGCFQGDVCIGLSGYWIATKLYSGKYLEIDNFVVDEPYRSKGVGKLLLDWLLHEAKAQACETAMLDAYVVNAPAHKFYLREGFQIKGFHFLKKL